MRPGTLRPPTAPAASWHGWCEECGGCPPAAPAGSAGRDGELLGRAVGPWRRARSPEHGGDLGSSCLSSSWLPVGTEGPGLRMPCRQHSGSSDASSRSLGSACACGLRAGGRCSATARARAPPPISRSSTGATTCRSRRARLWPCSRRPSPHGSRCAHQQAPRAYSWLSAGLRARFPAVACVHVHRYRELLSAALQDGEGHMFFCVETADLAGCV